MPKKSKSVPKPAALRSKLTGVSLGKVSKGYFVYTHRARSGFYSTPAKIPISSIKFVRSAG